MGRSSRQKFSDETLDKKYTVGQTDLKTLHRTSHPTAEEYTLFLSVQGTSSG